MPKRKIDKNHKKLFEDNKKEKLKKLMNEKNREYGSVVLKYAKDETAPERIPFGIKEIDDMLGGGIVCKRFNIIWGSKGSAKTTLAYMTIAQAQKMNKLCVFIDLERTFDGIRAQYFGVNLDNLILASSFTNAEQALDTLISMCKEGVVDFIVLDSIHALSPTGEQETSNGVEKSLTKDTMALLARKLSQFFRMSSAGVYKSNVAILLIGQSRTNIGGFVALETLSGGNALQSWSTLTIHAYRGSKSEAPTEKVEIDEEDEHGKKIKVKRIIGFQSILKLDKSKISGSKIEGSQTKLPFYFESGYIRKEILKDEKEQSTN